MSLSSPRFHQLPFPITVYPFKIVEMTPCQFFFYETLTCIEIKCKKVVKRWYCVHAVQKSTVVVINSSNNKKIDDYLLPPFSLTLLFGFDTCVTFPFLPCPLLNRPLFPYCKIPWAALTFALSSTVKQTLRFVFLFSANSRRRIYQTVVHQKLISRASWQPFPL